jgi:hypothetical protein
VLGSCQLLSGAARLHLQLRLVPSLVERSSAAGEEMLGALRKLPTQTMVAVTFVPTARPRQRLKTFWMRIQNLLHFREGNREKRPGI